MLQRPVCQVRAVESRAIDPGTMRIPGGVDIENEVRYRPDQKRETSGTRPWWRPGGGDQRKGRSNSCAKRVLPTVIY